MIDESFSLAGWNHGSYKFQQAQREVSLSHSERCSASAETFFFLSKCDEYHVC